MSTDLSKLAEKWPDVDSIVFATVEDHKKAQGLFEEYNAEILRLRAALAADIKICPSCRATDNNPYTDANGVRMRACGRCLIQWREEPLAAEEERVGKLVEAADKLAWATGVEIQGGHRTRAFISQHRAKCRYWIEQTEAALRDFQPTPAGEQK